MSSTSTTSTSRSTGCTSSTGKAPPTPRSREGRWYCTSPSTTATETPGSTVYVPASGVRELHAELQAKDYAFLNPGINNSPGNDQGSCLNLLDPFGNTLRIDERTTD